MGAKSSTAFVNADYKLIYDEDYAWRDGALWRPVFMDKDKHVKVFIDKGIIETIPINNSDLTVGWLLSEITRRYDSIYENPDLVKEKQLGPKQVIVGLKSVMFYPTLDFYLMQLDNLLSPIKSQTELVVHFAKIKPTKESVLQRSKVGPEDFKFLKIIGRGSYSYVTVARKKDSGRLYAIKIMKKAKLFKEVGKSTFISESEINKKFQGTPFVSDTYYAFQTEEEMFLVMELWPGGTLFDFLRRYTHTKLNYDIARFYIAEIIVALEFVHSKNVMYRDLKPENILIDVDGHIKLTDFGLSKELKTRNEVSETFWGSPEYLAPEMIFGRKHTRLIDFYTLGWLVYEIFVGYPPFYSGNSKELGEKMMKETLWFPKGLCKNAKDLIEWLINKDPDSRPNEFSQVKNHVFFENLHWGKLTKRQVIPPYIPDLYTISFDKSFIKLPIQLAFDIDTYLQSKSKDKPITQVKNQTLPKSAFSKYISSVKITRNKEQLNPKKSKASIRRDLDPHWLGELTHVYLLPSTFT